MNFSTSYLSKLCLLIVIILGGLIVNSCKKEKFAIPGNVGTIRFSANTYSIDLNAPDPLTIVLPLSLPLEEDATAVITIDTSSTALASEYVVTPLIPAGGLKLNLAKGATEASFKVTSLNNFEGERTVVFKLTEATGGLTVAKTNATATVTIKGKPIVLPSVTPSLSSLSFGNTPASTSSPSLSYTVFGVKLTSNITVTASANFQVSLNNTTFTSSLTIGFAAANAAPVTVYARFLPNTGVNQSITGTITHSSGTVPDAIINVSGAETGNAAAGVLIMKEDLNYGSTAGNLTTASGGAWTAYSASGANPVLYVLPGLSYTGYAGSGIGGALEMQNRAASSEDVIWTFPAQSSGTIYTAQLLNLASAPVTQDFFAALGDPTTPTPVYYNRIYAKASGAQFSLGLSRNATTIPAYSSTAYDYATTYLVVTKYEFGGASSIFILSGAIPLIEPATPNVSLSGGTDPASVIRIVIRQSTNSPLKVTYDGVRIATSWKQAVGL
ncbi:MAG: hypothetical protein ABI861_03230 [Panacibacter sp.]